MKTSARTASQAQLVRRAQRGDRDAFAQLVAHHARASYAIALSHLRNTADAEDATQEALVIALEKISSCRKPERFGAWLLAITRSCAQRRLRRRKLRELFALGMRGLDAQPTPAHGARQDALRALSVLRRRECEVLLLHDLEGWTHPEIGEALSISTAASRKITSRARAKMRAALTQREA